MTLYRPLLLVSFLSLGLCACGDSEPSPAGGAGGAPAGGAAAAPAGSAGGFTIGDPPSHVQTYNEGSGSGPNFTPAGGWTAYPPENGMRLANYRVTGVEGEGDGTVVIASWPSNLGGLEANAIRWMNQAGVKMDTADLSEDQRWELEVSGFVVTVFHLDAGAGSTATESDDHGAKGAPLLVAYIEKPGAQGCWTVKMTGPSATINRNKADFESFLKGL